MENLEQFTRKKDFLICVDSDGCAMDTMDIKHFRCFGPCLVEEWNLKDWETPGHRQMERDESVYDDPRDQPF